MILYRRKPVLVEAWQWVPYMEAEFTASGRPWWIEEALKRWPEVDGIIIYEHKPISISIKTPDAILGIDPGDWILRDANDRLHPCKLDRFEELYERWEGDI